MMAFSTVIRRETPLTLLREALWRSQKRWRQLNFSAAVEGRYCPVSYSCAGYYRPSLGDLEADSRKAIIDYATLLIRGRFPRFGSVPVPLGTPPNWHLDFVSGKTWPVVRSREIPLIGFDGSDVKTPWELSRLQFLPVLGKAWYLTGNPQFRNSAKSLLSDWITKNPVSRGVNWTVAMEAALRGMSICWLLELLIPFARDEQSWLSAVTRSLWEHLLFIEAHNEFSHFVRSNHYLSNLAGLVCISSYLEGPGIQVRRQEYSKLLQREAVSQTYQDGGDFEASTGYHFLKVQMFTISAMLMRARGLPLTADFLHVLVRMYRFMSTLVDSEGCLPQVGDCDDGRVELLHDDIAQTVHPSHNRQHSLNVSGQLGLGSALLHENFGGHARDIAWYGLGKAAGLSVVDKPALEIFPASGVAVARRGLGEVLFFAMPNGIAGKGSHTHNDKLSVIFRLAGEELFSDCGTFCYTRDPKKRNRFRSTSSHNTVRIDGQEQNPFSESRGQLFCMSDQATVAGIQSGATADCLRLQAEHSGYRSLGVNHVRSLSFLNRSTLVIEDRLVGTGVHSVEANWHIPATWSVNVRRAQGRELECAMQGVSSVQMKITSSVDIGLHSTVGSISRAYGHEASCTILSACCRSAMPLHIVTTIVWRE